MHRDMGILQIRQHSSKPDARLPAKIKSDILHSSRTSGEEKPPQKRRTELDDIAMEISNELERNEEVSRGGGVIRKVKDAKKNKQKKKKKKKPEPIKFDFRKFKYVEPVDDEYVMEYALTPDEIMNYRKNHFQIERDPRIEVRDTKSSELKEEFGTYCGIKKTIKNWLYWT